MKEKLIIVGIGLQASEVIDFVTRYDLYEIVGFAVDKAYLIDSYQGLPVYPLDELENFVDKNAIKLFIAINWYNKSNSVKRQKFENLKYRGFHFANLISPNSKVYPQIGEGNWIHDFAHVEWGCMLGDNNTILTHALTAHCTQLGSHNTLVGRATIAGNTIVGDQNFFGIGSVVYDHLVIGNNCIIGGGAVVKQDLSDFSIVVPQDSICLTGSTKVNEIIMSTKGQKLLKLLYQKND